MDVLRLVTSKSKSTQIFFAGVDQGVGLISRILGANNLELFRKIVVEFVRPMNRSERAVALAHSCPLLATPRTSPDTIAAMAQPSFHAELADLLGVQPGTDEYEEIGKDLIGEFCSPIVLSQLKALNMFERPFFDQYIDRILASPELLATINGSGYSMLDLACRCGHLDAVRRIVQNEFAKTNLIDRFGGGGAPLVISLASGHWDAALALLDAGAEPSAPSPDSMWDGALTDALILACRQETPTVPSAPIIAIISRIFEASPRHLRFYAVRPTKRVALPFLADPILARLALPNE